jgi:EAL domain-containing protein (putative c-di-GMP-specific phosphodiesterase class I)
LSAAQKVADLVTAHLINARARENRPHDLQYIGPTSVLDEPAAVPHRTLILQRPPHRDEPGRPDEITDLAKELLQAQARGEFHVEYQPILAAPSSRITGFEALARWTHPTKGPIPPATFIPLAEKAGLINQLGGWVLVQACIDRNRWQAKFPNDVLDMAVNVSVHQLMSPGFTASVAAVLAATKADPRRLILEITESVFIQDGERALVVMGELNKLGVRLALDDFGTGYSSLSYLKRFPVQILKIDRTFIVDLRAGRRQPQHRDRDREPRARPGHGGHRGRRGDRRAARGRSLARLRLLPGLLLRPADAGTGILSSADPTTCTPDSHPDIAPICNVLTSSARRHPIRGLPAGKPPLAARHFVAGAARAQLTEGQGSQKDRDDDPPVCAPIPVRGSGRERADFGGLPRA